MAVKKSKKIAATAARYSKRTATFVSVSWIILRIFTLLVMTFRPELGGILNNWIAGVDSVMMINLGFYTGNSVVEKGILAWFDTQKMKHEDSEEEEEGGNG